MENVGTQTRWDDETRRLADELLEKVAANGGSLDCYINFWEYCIEVNEMTISTIRRLYIEDGILWVVCEEFIEQRHDRITDYRPAAIKKIHETIIK